MTKKMTLMFCVVLGLAACSFKDNIPAGNMPAEGGATVSQQSLPMVSAPAPMSAKTARVRGDVAEADKEMERRSAERVDSFKANESIVPPPADDRKIIHNAHFEIELDQPWAAQHKVASIAQSSGGYVVNSETRSQNGSQQVNIVVRVPATQFGTVVEQIRAQLGDKEGGKIRHDNVTGQDVTEEFVDLEARIKTKKALEEQFLVIMRSANKVTDALEVQTQIAEVRGEIEQMEGRRRYLMNQAALSTITVALHTPAPIVMASTKGFWREVKQAFADGLDAALSIVLGMIRFALAFLPVLVLVVLPLWFLGRWLWRLRQRRLSATPVNNA